MRREAAFSKGLTDSESKCDTAVPASTKSRVLPAVRIRFYPAMRTRFCPSRVDGGHQQQGLLIGALVVDDGGDGGQNGASGSNFGKSLSGRS